MRYTGIFAYVILGLVSVTLIGCTVAQLTKAASVATSVANVANKISGASTQPAIQTIEALAPQVAPIVEGGALVAKLIAGVAGLAATGLGGLALKRGVNLTDVSGDLAIATTAINEIVPDIQAYKQPGQSWLPTTEKLLTDLGHVEAAAVQA